MPDRVLAQSWLPDIDVSGAATSLVGWLQRTFGVVFDLFRDVLDWMVETAESLLTAPPEIVMVAILTLLAATTRRWGFVLYTALAFLVVVSMGHFEATMLSLAMVLVSALLAVAFGVPLGILAARNGVVSTAVRPLLDFMQTMPAFVYLLLAVTFFRIGVVPGVIASFVFSMPPAVRLTELGIRQVDAEVVEAARAFGARPRAVLTGVQLPLAMPSIMAGINQVIMLALSMVVIAGLSGGGGLGGIVVEGVTRLRIGLGIEGGLAVVILAIFLDRLTASLGARIEPTGSGA